MLSNLRRWARNGPNSDDGTIGWIVGHWLHWRMWVTMTLAILPIFAGLLALQHAAPFWAIIATAVVAQVSEPAAMRFSPKYDVSTNY